MKLKLDENLGPSIAVELRGAGYDVLMATDQGLGGRGDEVVAEVCRAEQRCLVTLDLDFANPIAFPPARFSPSIAADRRRRGPGTRGVCSKETSRRPRSPPI